MKTIKTMTLIAALGLFTACNESNRAENAEVSELASADTAVMYGDEQGRVEADGAEIKTVDENYWNNVDYNAPMVQDTRFTGNDIEARADNNNQIYMMDERLLFDVDKAQLRAGAEDKLRSVSESIREVGGANAPVRIYGYTDSTASASYNRQLAEERATTVMNWFRDNGNIDASRMSIHPMGQQNPRATNETAEGRQQNRRVAIVVAKQQ